MSRRGLVVLHASGLGLLLVLALAVRWPQLSRDLYDDEALETTVTRTLLQTGQLNNFLYSRFTPAAQYKGDTWGYYPPGFPAIQAAFLAAAPSNVVAARLPVLLANLLVLLTLPAVAKRMWGRTLPGWMGALLWATGTFGVTETLTSVPYALAPPLLFLALLWFFDAIESDRPSRWLRLGLVIAAGFYVLQMVAAMAIFPFVTGIRRTRRDWRRAIGPNVCLAIVAIGCLPWIVWTTGLSTPAGNFLMRAPTYSLGGQAALVLSAYGLMLPGVLMRVCFATGLLALGLRVRRLGAWRGLVVGMWSLAPLAYLASRNMWITPKHTFPAFPAVMLVSGFGVVVLAEVVADMLGRIRPALQKRSVVAAVAVAAVLFGAVGEHRRLSSTGALEVAELGVVRGDAAVEFGDPLAVSSACALIVAARDSAPVIAPVGQSEAHYLGRFVYSRRTPADIEAAWNLAKAGPAWVFVGDNYIRRGALDDFDRAVIRQGQLVFKSAPVPGFTDPANAVGYALYRVSAPLVRTPAAA